MALSICAATCIVACNGANQAGPSAPSAEILEVEEKISGVWRVTNYIPEKELSPALLMAMQSDKIMVRFEEGTVRSISPSLQFERRYRIADVNGDTFHLFIEDKGGIEYESVCQLDNLGSMSFQTVTEPWRGRGVLTREGPALDPVK